MRMRLVREGVVGLHMRVLVVRVRMIWVIRMGTCIVVLVRVTRVLVWRLAVVLVRVCRL